MSVEWDSTRRLSQVFSSNLQGSRLRGRPTNRWWSFVRADISKCRLKTGKGDQEMELSGINPLRRGRSPLVCSAI
jgi:hypothetical protein